MPPIMGCPKNQNIRVIKNSFLLTFIFIDVIAREERPKQSLIFWEIASLSLAMTALDGKLI